MSVQTESERMVPGIFWYAYGSAAYDVAKWVRDERPGEVAPRLSVVEGGVAYRDSPIKHIPNAEKLGSRPRTEACPSSIGAHVANAIDRGASRPQRCRRSEPSARVPHHAWVLAALVSIALVGSFVAFSAQRVAAVETPLQTEVYAVSLGDSLWSIATEHPIDGYTTQQVLSWIVDRNDLSSSVITPGQALVVPGGADGTGR